MLLRTAELNASSLVEQSMCQAATMLRQQRTRTAPRPPSCELPQKRAVMYNVPVEVHWG